MSYVWIPVSFIYKISIESKKKSLLQNSWKGISYTYITYDHVLYIFEENWIESYVLRQEWPEIKRSVYFTWNVYDGKSPDRLLFWSVMIVIVSEWVLSSKKEIIYRFLEMICFFLKKNFENKKRTFILYHESQVHFDLIFCKILSCFF